MRKIVVLEMVTLDGVMQAPGGPDEDRSSDFKFGGWTWPHSDDIGGNVVRKQMSGSYDLLLGRKTYDIFANYWPKQTGPIADPFNAATKYVVSHKPVKLSWEKSVLIDGDVVAKLKELKQQNGPMLQVHGSGNLVQTLLKNDLADEVWLRIYPIVLGSGKHLFAEGTIPAAFKLIDSVTTPKGVIIASYKRAGKVKIGSFE